MPIARLAFGLITFCMAAASAAMSVHTDMARPPPNENLMLSTPIPAYDAIAGVRDGLGNCRSKTAAATRYQHLDQIVMAQSDHRFDLLAVVQRRKGSIPIGTQESGNGELLGGDS